MDEHDIVSTIKMERMTHKGAFLILEGSQDVKRLNPFIDKASCSIVCTHSVRKASKACHLLNSKNFNGFLTLIDADFKRLKISNIDCKNLIHSEFHDLDLDWITIDILDKYLDEVADKSKVIAHGGTQAIFDLIINELKPVSCARLLNHEKIFKFKVNNIDVGNFIFNTKNIIDSYINELIRLMNIDASQKIIIENTIRQKCGFNYDLMQITNGHDFCSALGAFIRLNLSNRKNPQTWGNEVALHLRLATEHKHFNKFHVTSLIRKWENTNALKILNC